MKKGQKNPKSKDLSERKQELFKLLVTNDVCSFNYLATSLEVSKRTVKRYLDELEESVPLEFIMGRYTGGVRLGTKERSRKFLKKPEIQLLEKLVSEGEEKGNCTLDQSDMAILKEMIYRYS